MPNRSNPLWRGFVWLIGFKPVSLWLMKIAAAVDGPLMQISGGRLRLSFVIPLLLLRHQGAKSGLERITPLLYIPDGDELLLIASNAGQSRSPAWSYNLRANPCVSCLVHQRWFSYVATELQGQSRELAWRKAVDMFPGYERYAMRVNRQIPVFRLQPASSEA